MPKKNLNLKIGIRIKQHAFAAVQFLSAAIFMAAVLGADFLGCAFEICDYFRSER